MKKMVFGMYLIVWHFWPFLMVLAWKNIFGLLWNLWLSYCCRLGIKSFFWGQMSFLFYHGTILEDTNGFADEVTSQGKRQCVLGKDFENYGTLYSILT